MTQTTGNKFTPINESIKANIENLKNEFGDSSDLKIRQIENVAIIHLEGIVDEKSINENIVNPKVNL